jgi:putative FmdB family regulatory protein
MPLYEYRCEKCERVFEVMQKFSDTPLTEHEGCGGAVERLISAPAFQFKGSGWYITDYARAGSGGKKGSGESKGESKSESKTESKSESKSETKAPASAKSE